METAIIRQRWGTLSSYVQCNLKDVHEIKYMIFCHGNTSENKHVPTNTASAR